jgi:hypothetical protein
MDEFGDIGRRVRDERPELSGARLDELKREALSRASGDVDRRMSGRARVISLVLAVALVGTGGAAVYAATHASSGGGNSAGSQYCSPNGGSLNGDLNRCIHKGGGPVPGTH